MTNKFKTGDKVIRICEYCATEDGGFMQEGGEYIVKSLVNDNEVVFEGCDIEYSCSYFKLAEEKPTFKAMKFKVNSPKQSKEIQEALFSMGYGWASHGMKAMFLEEDFTGWIYTEESGLIWRRDFRHIENGWADIKLPEFSVKTTKSYTLIPVKNVKEELVELMGQKYSKKELENALRNLKPVN